MSFIRALAATLALPAALALVGCAAVSAPEDEQIGQVAQAQGLLNVRSGPGFNYRVVYQIPRGTSLAIVCYTNDPQGNYWYQLGDGNYVLASVVGGGNYPACVGVGWHPPGLR